MSTPVCILADAGGAWLAGDLPTGIASDGFVTLSGQSEAFENGICLLRALFAAPLLGVVAAAALAWRARARMQLWTLALQRVAGGDLGARLPHGAADDDVDDMSAQINAVLERLADTVEGMRQVSTDIAHDLKTPLNRLYINLEAAAQQAHHGHCGEAVLERALEEAREIDETFEALLRIARIEAGAPKARFGQFDLLEVLRDAFEVYAPVTGSDAVELVLKPSGPLPMIGDRALMLQLVANLIENARRHGGSTIGSIALDGERVPGGIRLVVTNDGAGIPEPERENDFQRLYRLERSRTTPRHRHGAEPCARYRPAALRRSDTGGWFSGSTGNSRIRRQLPCRAVAVAGTSTVVTSCATRRMRGKHNRTLALSSAIPYRSRSEHLVRRTTWKSRSRRPSPTR